MFFFFFSSRRRHTRLTCDWSSDVCSSDLHDVRALLRLVDQLAQFICQPTVPLAGRLGSHLHRDRQEARVVPGRVALEEGLDLLGGRGRHVGLPPKRRVHRPPDKTQSSSAAGHAPRPRWWWRRSAGLIGQAQATNPASDGLSCVPLSVSAGRKYLGPPLYSSYMSAGGGSPPAAGLGPTTASVDCGTD